MTTIDLVLPLTCLACGHRYPYGPHPVRELVSGTPLCPVCRSVCRPHRLRHRCPVCSIPLPQHVTLCQRCRTSDFAFARAISVHRYDGVAAEVVRAFKFGRHRSLARVIGAAITPVIRAHTDSSAVLVPAPSRAKSVRARGFAGAELIAREAAARSGRDVAHLLRMAAGTTQKTLSAQKRRENAGRAVSVRPGARVPPLVVLVDDVLTTGTTADACARALVGAGAREVVVLTFAIEY